MMTIDEAIKHCKEIACEHNECANQHKQLAEWLNELKELRSQNTWKPSDEQMENLSRAFNGGTYQTSLLMELYQDLKKLREE